MSDHTDTLTDTERALIADSMPFPTTDREWATLTRNLESIVAARVAAARANERAKWVAKLRVAEADLTPPHNCELLPDGHADPEMAAWVDGRHDAVDVLRALIEGADQ